MRNNVPDLTVKAADKQKPKLWVRDYLLICFSSLSIFFYFHSQIPTLPLYVETFTGRSDLAGLPLAALTLGALLIRPLTGWALDTYGRKVVLLGGILLFLIPGIIYIWMIPAYLLILLRFFQGFGWGISNTALNTVAADIIPRQRIGEGIGYFAVTMTLPMAISPGVSLWVLDNYSFPILFSFSTILIVLCIIFVIIIRIPQIKSPQREVKGKRSLVLLERSSFRPALVLLMLTLSYSSIMSLFPVFAKQQGIPATGLFFAAMSITTLIIRPCTGTFIDKYGELGYKLAVTIGGIAICISMFTLSNAASASHLVLGGILYGAGFGMGQPTLLALCIMRATPDRKGAANGTYWTAYDTGIMIGSILWGLVAAATSFKTMFLMNMIPILAAIVIFYGRGRRILQA